MTAPRKPWEPPCRRAPTNNYVDELGYPMRSSATIGPPPPLPPRSQYGSSNYSSYSSGYGGGYGGYGGGYGGYGMPYSPYRSPYDSRYGFSADENSPFQSVESVVRAISSLSMMMESTYQSMFMSFRAVMGVAENMDKLRRVLFDLFGSLAAVKYFIWFVKKALYVMGLISNNPSSERLWEAAAAEVVAAPPRRTWPLVAFFALMLGGPYVLYRLLPGADAGWDPRQDGVQCVAIYDFASSQEDELPFRRGEVLIRQRKARSGWALATKKNGQRGYVPTDRLKTISSAQMKVRAPMAPPPQDSVDDSPAPDDAPAPDDPPTPLS